jgi:hypothetical protein
MYNGGGSGGGNHHLFQAALMSASPFSAARKPTSNSATSTPSAAMTTTNLNVNSSANSRNGSNPPISAANANAAAIHTPFGLSSTSGAFKRPFSATSSTASPSSNLNAQNASGSAGGTPGGGGSTGGDGNPLLEQIADLRRKLNGSERVRMDRDGQLAALNQRAQTRCVDFFMPLLQFIA